MSRATAPCTAASVLRGALEALSGSPDAWLPDRPFATVDASGRKCDPWSEGAARWGLMAALGRARPTVEARIEAADWIKRATGTMFVARWEEEPGRTTAEVVAMLTRAIALATGGGRP